VATIRLGFSPDSDDLFMFWPLLQGHVPSTGYRFDHVRSDTQTLNRIAQSGDLDVVAISIAAYPYVAEHYQLLPHGGSVGRGYGPIVIANEPVPLAALAGKSIAVPGEGTTAYLVLRLLLVDFRPVFIPITPYRKVFDALRTGDVDAALLIHEGRLTFEKEGFAAVADIGQAWADLTGLPLPLGGNVIRRALGADAIREISSLLRQSITWALSHRDQLLDEILARETRTDLPLTREVLDRYLAMYANSDTLEYPDDARQAVTELIRRGSAAGLLPGVGSIDWAP
jgi:1,4-dihydroxy-6-naphthoate synthase